MSTTPKDTEQVRQAVRDWWRTSIIDMAPGSIRYSGYPIQELIGRVGFAQMIWLMTRGELPSEGEARLLDAALVAAVDHGPQPPRARASTRRSTATGSSSPASATASPPSTRARRASWNWWTRPPGPAWSAGALRA